MSPPSSHELKQASGCLAIRQEHISHDLGCLPSRHVSTWPEVRLVPLPARLACPTTRVAVDGAEVVQLLHRRVERRAYRYVLESLPARCARTPEGQTHDLGELPARRRSSGAEV